MLRSTKVKGEGEKLLQGTSHGHCGFGTSGADCNTEDSGSWQFNRTEAKNWKVAQAACARRCNACARCQFVSYSLKERDCSWFAMCNMENLKFLVQDFRSQRVRHIKPSARQTD